MIICAIEKEVEALAAFAAEEESAKPSKEQQQQQKVEEHRKVEDAPDGKFEDFVAAGVRTAELVAAGARAASHVAEAVLNLRRSGGDDVEPAHVISADSSGIGANAFASISSGIS